MPMGLLNKIVNGCIFKLESVMPRPSARTKISFVLDKTKIVQGWKVLFLLSKVMQMEYPYKKSFENLFLTRNVQFE